MNEKIKCLMLKSVKCNKQQNRTQCGTHTVLTHTEDQKKKKASLLSWLIVFELCQNVLLTFHENSFVLCECKHLINIWDLCSRS